MLNSLRKLVVPKGQKTVNSRHHGVCNGEVAGRPKDRLKRLYRLVEDGVNRPR